MKRKESRTSVMGNLSWLFQSFERQGVFYRRTTTSFNDIIRWSVVRFDYLYKDGFILNDVNPDDQLYKNLEQEYQELITEVVE